MFQSLHYATNELNTVNTTVAIPMHFAIPEEYEKSPKQIVWIFLSRSRWQFDSSTIRNIVSLQPFRFIDSDDSFFLLFCLFSIWVWNALNFGRQIVVFEIRH